MTTSGNAGFGVSADPQPAEPPRGCAGRIGVVATVGVGLEASMYSVVAPLLPYYQDRFHLSTTAAGILTATYAIGLIIGAVLGGILVERIGARGVVGAGFILFAVASLIFGLAPDVVTLCGARSAQGVGGGGIWAGLLAWLIGAHPSGKRGRVIGTVAGAATFGTIFGPVIGTVAVAVGTVPTFVVIAAACAAMVTWVIYTRAGPTDIRAKTDWPRALRSSRLFALTALCFMPGIVLGAVNALVPLRLAAGGFDESAVGATFLVGALAGAVAAPVVGRLSDSRGRVPLAVAGFAVTSPALAVLGLSRDVVLTAVLTAAVFGLGVTIIAVPLMARLSEVSQDSGLGAGPGAALLNLTFAGGEAVGAPAAAVLADQISETLPFICLGVVGFSAALVLLARQRRRDTPST